MWYEHEYMRSHGGRGTPRKRPLAAGRGRGYDEPAPRRRPRRRHRDRPRFPPEGPGYSGPGELGRYGDAPVPYGPDHTYDFRFGDRYGYGPDFYEGEARVRRDPGLRSRRRPGPRR